MANRIIRIKNAGTIGGTWNGVTIPMGIYYDIPFTDSMHWSEDATVVADISNGTLVVNKGADLVDDIINIVEALNWLSSELNPSRTVDGDLTIVQENNAHVTGNKVINWTLEEYLNASNTFSEIFIIPNGRTATINFLQGGSYTVPTYISLEYFQMINGTMQRINPDIRPDEVPTFSIATNHLIGDTVLTINNTNNEIDLIDITPTSNLYCFDDAGNIFYANITAIDIVAGTIILSSPLTVNVSAGTLSTNVSRVIGQKGTQISSSELSWVSPPRFYGDGVSYLKVTIENKDVVNDGLVTASLNGWHTPSTGGN